MYRNTDIIVVSVHETISLVFLGYPQALCVLHQHPSFIISYPYTISIILCCKTLYNNNNNNNKLT